MKTLLLYLSLVVSIPVFCQSPTDLIKNMEAKSEAVYYSNEDDELVTKYYITGSFDVVLPESFIDATLSVNTIDQDGAEVTINTLHIINNPEPTEPFNPDVSGYFIEGDKVYFFLSSVETPDNLSLHYRAVGGGGGHPPAIQTACQRLPPVKVAVTPANPN